MKDNFVKTCAYRQKHRANVHWTASSVSVILSAEKKITFLHDLRLLPTENLERILEDVFRREYIYVRGLRSQ